MEEVLDLMMHLAWWKIELWVRIKLTGLLRYGLGPATNARLDQLLILHASPHFIVVNKRYDVLINCDDRNIKVTVENQLKQLMPDRVNTNLTHSFHFIHRLDYPTSGVLCIGGHRKASSCASEAFAGRHTRKYYLALVRGHVANETVDIQYSVGFDTRPENMGHKMCTDEHWYCKRPRSAMTRLRVLELGTYDNYPATKVLLKPITGRRHQLRVHCSALGHTIVGDFSYSNQKDMRPYRMFLHAQRLVLPTEYEHLDVRTDDPFTNRDPRNKWRTLHVVNAFDPQSDDAYRQIDTQKAQVTVGSAFLRTPSTATLIPTPEKLSHRPTKVFLRK